MYELGTYLEVRVWIKKPFERRGDYGRSPGPFGGGRRGGSSNGEGGKGEQERPPHVLDHHSGSGHRNEVKHEGASRVSGELTLMNWLKFIDEIVNEGEINMNAKKPLGEEDAADGNKEISAIEIEEFNS